MVRPGDTDRRRRPRAARTRYNDIGEAAFEPLSRRPHTSPTATAATTVQLIRQLRKQLTEAGLDTIAWHLARHHQLTVSVSTVSRTLARESLAVPEPKKRPKSSYLRFAAAMPNQCWQSDFTHYRLADGLEVEVISWLDDCTRYALHVFAHRRVTTPIVLATFREAAAQHCIPASTLTDNGLVYTRPVRRRPRRPQRHPHLRKGGEVPTAYARTW